MKIKWNFILFVGICWAFVAQAQTNDSGGSSHFSLNGVYVLENFDLYRYSGEDSIQISNDLLFPDNAVTGVFETLTFSGETCGVTIRNYYVESSYRRIGDVLELMPSAVSHTYLVLEDNQPFVLYRYYFTPNENDPLELVRYGIKLYYVKKQD
jgi:hypothetical protein